MSVEPILITDGDYWARIIPTGRRGWFALYGHGPMNYSEINSRAWSYERIEHKVHRRLARWVERDLRAARRVEEAR